MSEFLYIVTVGYTICLATEIMQLKNIGDASNDKPDLEEVSDVIVGKIWMEDNISSIITPEADKAIYEYCMCAEGMHRIIFIYILIIK